MLINKHSIPSMLLTGTLFFSPVFAQEAPSPQQVLQNFGIEAAQIAQLERGEIVSYDVSETSQKELAIGVAMIMPVPLPQIVDYIKKGNLNATETDIIASGQLTDNAGINKFQKFGFTDKQVDEARAFLDAEPGDKFNLSKQELDDLKNLQASMEEANNKTLLKTANQKYQEFLLQRFAAYRKNGLSGIAAYNRDGGNADPAAELRNDAINSKAWARYFPELQQAWLNYPATLPANASEQFLWLNRRVEGRPTPSSFTGCSSPARQAALSCPGSFMSAILTIPAMWWPAAYPTKTVRWCFIRSGVPPIRWRAWVAA